MTFRGLLRLSLVAALTGPMLLSGCSQSPEPAKDKAPNGDNPDPVISVSGEDKEMNAAIARARSEVDAFITILNAHGADSFSVKMPVHDGKQVEHFWLTNVTYADGVFTGEIDNDPEFVHTVKLGQTVSVKKEEISDWLYMKDGKMYGNYTVRVLLPKMDPDEAAKIKAMLAN
jgi:uncharacterized protein YegJ (DUF2314 family)